MSDTDFEAPETKSERRGGISVVWVVPIIAALIGGAVA